MTGTIVRKLCAQVVGGPSGERAQSVFAHQRRAFPTPREQLGWSLIPRRCGLVRHPGFSRPAGNTNDAAPFRHPLTRDFLARGEARGRAAFQGASAVNT